MREVTFDGRRVRISASLRTLMVYEDEFGQDVFSVIGPAFERGRQMDGGRFAFSLGDLPLAGVVRLLWAEAKTCDPMLPSYPQWLAAMGGSPDVNASHGDWFSGAVEEAALAFLLDAPTAAQGAAARGATTES